MVEASLFYFCQTLDVSFAFPRLAFGFIRFGFYERHRAVRASVFGALSGVVFFDSASDVKSDPRVKRVVSTANDICMPFFQRTLVSFEKEYSVAVTLTTDTEEGDVRIREKIAIVLSIAVFILVFGLLCWPMVCAIRLVGWLFRRSERAIRSQIARCAHWWGSVVFYSACKLLRLDVKIAVEGDRCLIIDRSCVVIANHQSTLDIAVITWLVNRNRLGKFSLGHEATASKSSGARMDSGAHRQRICLTWEESGERLGNRTLRRDSARRQCVHHPFSGGYAFRACKGVKKFKHVLPPKRQGSICFAARCRTQPLSRSRFSGIRRLPTVRVAKPCFKPRISTASLSSLNIRIVAPHEVRSDEEWLERDWEAKDRILSPP